jgi:hypothetical protein
MRAGSAPPVAFEAAVKEHQVPHLMEAVLAFEVLAVVFSWLTHRV